MKHTFFTLLFLWLCIGAKAQLVYDWHEAKWANGLCETDSAHIFRRMPGYVQPLVTPGAWSQSVAAAGEFLHIKTNARAFLIKYTLVNKNFALPHMAATGMSGLDLYAKDANGVWNWSPPFKYTFGDTCVFEYHTLKVAAKSTVDFFVYLPLYSTLQWISVGVPQGSVFEYQEPQQDQPIVGYGTSIMQGAVASRPGLAWTNILERNLDRTVINLGFSGNGRFEAPVFDLMAKVNAKLYILDCMPNLTDPVKYPADEIEKRVRYGITKLRQDHPGVPILFAEHADGNQPYNMDSSKVNTYHRSSQVITNIFNKLKTEGLQNISLLTEKEINFDANSTTEGTHPNDIGMMKYAEAYEKKIREMINEPIGEISPEKPIEQYQDGFDWRKRHEQIIENTISTNPKAIIFANSIINYWGGEPVAEKTAPRGTDAWQKYMSPEKVQNAGFGYDRIENVLWRIYHGELDHFNGSKIILDIGTNNLSLNTDEEIVSGLSFLIQQIKLRKPGTAILVGGILPRKGMLERVQTINVAIKKMAVINQCKFFDFSSSFLTGGLLNDTLFGSDGLHPNTNGYEVLGRNFQQLLRAK